jgi:hypothetical protein
VNRDSRGGVECSNCGRANMTNPRKPNEGLTAPDYDPRGDGVPADIGLSAEGLRVGPRSPLGQCGTLPVVWSLASRTASLAAPAATFGVRQGATTLGSDVR